MPMMLLDALAHHARTRPDAPALTWLEDGEAARSTWSYRDLAGRVAGMAAAVRTVASAGDRVLLITPEGPDQAVALLGCVLAGVVPVPLHLPDGPRADDARRKIAGVADDTAPVAVLSTVEGEDEAVGPLRGTAWADRPVLHVESVAPADPDWAAPPRADDDLAWLQYTSGSTGDPKGVCVAHGPLARNLHGFDVGFDHADPLVVVTWLPGVHDLGVVYGLALPLWKGGHAVRMAPDAFVRRPARWVRALHAWRGTHTASPDFGFALAAARTPAEATEGLDLSCVRVVLNGAEPIRHPSEKAFLDRFVRCRLDPAAVRHAYGMSEAVAVMSKEDVGTPRVFRSVARTARTEGRLVDSTEPEAAKVAGNGRAIEGLTIAAVDPATGTRLGPDAIGELWLHGDTLGIGYFGRPDASTATFGARTTDGVGPWTRTGDLGAVGTDGTVYVTGRLKDVLVVRGANHHAEDLEHTLERSHRALRPGGAVCVADVGPDGAEAVAVIAEVRPEDLPVDAVVGAVRAALADTHGIAPVRIVLVPPRAVPKTSSGKRRRRESARMLHADAFEVLGAWRIGEVAEAPRGPDVGDQVRGWIAGRLGIPASAVPVDVPLRDLGLDSLQLMELAEALSGWVGRSVAPSDLFAHPTVQALVSAVAPQDDAVEGDALVDAVDAALDALDDLL